VSAVPVTRRPRRGSLSSERAGTIAISVGTLLAVLLAWEIVPRTDLVSRTILPTVSDTARGLVQLVTGGYWWDDLRVTLVAVAVSWVLGCSLGLVMGVVLGTSPFVRTAITPYAIAVQALPKIVLAPLFIGWLGFGTQSKVAVAVAICFFPVWIDTMIGLALPSSDEFRLMASLRASRWQTFRMLQLPSAIPMIMVGVKHAMLLAFTGVLVAEILAASAGGLGTLAKEFSLQLNMPLTLAIILVVLVLAVSLVSLMDRLEQRVVFWSEASRARRP
jgi:NitT/TauT family transport system permease protein